MPDTHGLLAIVADRFSILGTEVKEGRSCCLR